MGILETTSVDEDQWQIITVNKEGHSINKEGNINKQGR